MKTFLLTLALSLSLLFHSTACFPFDGEVTGATVTVVNSIDMPDAMSFMISKPVANCPAGYWLRYDGGPFASSADTTKLYANNKAVLAALLTALASGKPVTVYAYNVVGGVCRVQAVYVTNL